jgi:peroxiredoxin Q/BCP
VGISSQDLASHEAFTAKHALNVPLLADVDQDVARKYDAFSQRLGVKRAVIVIDEQGIVRHRHDHLLGLDYQSVDELKAALDALPAPATG